MAKHRKSSVRKIMPLVSSNVAGAALIGTGLFIAAGHAAPQQFSPTFKLTSVQCNLTSSLCAGDVLTVSSA
ncbi:MAG: hypothetical protein ACOYBX_10900, partial [Mycobacterium sp.]